MEAAEEEKISSFIQDKKLKPVGLFNTHPHIDHVAGNKFISETFKIPLTVHQEALQILRGIKGYAAAFGFNEVDYVEPGNYIADKEKIQFGNSELTTLYTPGHADGSICFYSKKDKFVIVGDVLFNEGIGRTDFPTGNYDKLMDSIKTKLFALPEDTLVYPGHGSTTTIGYEKENNPFLS
jgi:glyoxylase-like metal-dependent hydrolase (beta-lactamase superfamily II)